MRRKLTIEDYLMRKQKLQVILDNFAQVKREIIAKEEKQIKDYYASLKKEVAWGSDSYHRIKQKEQKEIEDIVSKLTAYTTKEVDEAKAEIEMLQIKLSERQ